MSTKFVIDHITEGLGISPLKTEIVEFNNDGSGQLAAMNFDEFRATIENNPVFDDLSMVFTSKVEVNYRTLYEKRWTDFLVTFFRFRDTTMFTIEIKEIQVFSAAGQHSVPTKSIADVVEKQSL